MAYQTRQLMIPVGCAGAFVDEQQPETCGGPAQQLTQQLSSSQPRSGSRKCLTSCSQPCHLRLVSACGANRGCAVGPVSTLCSCACLLRATGQYCGLRHGVCETCATFWSTKRHPRLLNGSFFPLRGLTGRVFLLQKGGGAQKKADFFYFSLLQLFAVHILGA